MKFPISVDVARACEWYSHFVRAIEEMFIRLKVVTWRELVKGLLQMSFSRMNCSLHIGGYRETAFVGIGIINNQYHSLFISFKLVVLMLLVEGMLLEELQHGLGQSPVDFGLGDKRVEISRSHCVV